MHVSWLALSSECSARVFLRLPLVGLFMLLWHVHTHTLKYKPACQVGCPLIMSDFALDACLEGAWPTTGKYQDELRELWDFWLGLNLEAWCSWGPLGLLLCAVWLFAPGAFLSVGVCVCGRSLVRGVCLPWLRRGGFSVVRAALLARRCLVCGLAFRAWSFRGLVFCARSVGVWCSVVVPFLFSHSLYLVVKKYKPQKRLGYTTSNKHTWFGYCGVLVPSKLNA